MKLLLDLVKKNHGFNVAFQTASKGIFDKEAWIRSSSYELFEALFERGQYIDESIQKAKNGLANDEIKVRSNALKLFKLLAKHGHGQIDFLEAAKTLKENRLGTLLGFRTSIEIFKILFDEKQGFEEAVNLATEGLKSKKKLIRQSSLSMLEILIQHDQGFSQAIKNCSQGH